MSALINYYRIWCSTDSKWVYEWAETKPTTCHENRPSHTIDTAKTSIQKSTDPNDPTLITNTLDMNDASAVTPSHDIGNLGTISYEVQDLSGAHSSHVAKLQCSMNDVDWGDVAGATVAGLGSKMGVAIPTRYCRVAVDTVEGEASAVTIIMQAKK